MKRLTLLAIVLVTVTIAVSSPVRASSPVIYQQNHTLSAIFSRYFANFMRTIDGRITEGVLVEETSDDDLVRGDADDYANGRIKPDGNGDGELDLLPPVYAGKKVLF
ncbi:MAG: hypothetical protein KAV42_00235 [Candidatus Krumholzibacteria bacterium]|nr:hypothetical protein [Candidatus Krumholzibacteria bacterium]